MTIVIRVDAANTIGRGHAMRCLSLAEGLRAWGSEPQFICRQLPGDLIALLKSYDFVVHTIDEGDDAELTLAILQTLGRVDLLFVDHYGLDHVWEKKVRAVVSKLVVLDDLANRFHDCDILLDPSLDRVTSDYENLVPKECKLLIGASYALLSRRYSQLRHPALSRRSHVDCVRRVLVSMGGTDPKNATSWILDAMVSIDAPLTIDVVVGSQWAQLDALKEKAKCSHHMIHFHIDVSNLAELVYEADLAIGAGGVSSYERCCLGLPTLLVAIADNQLHNAQVLHEKNAALFLGDVDVLSNDAFTHAINKLIQNSKEYQRISQMAATVCDGYGVNRVVAALLLNENALTLRPARLEDSKVMFQWQQDPSTRQYARNTKSPSWSEHEIWFQKRLNNPNCLFNIMTVNGVSVGVLRFDRRSQQSNCFEISILVAPLHRKKGFAAEALNISRKIFPNLDFYAEVHSDNEASHQLFLTTGYVFEDTGYINRGEQYEN